MKDITLLNIIHKVKISFSPPFTPKIGDLGNKSPVVDEPLQETYCLFLWPATGDSLLVFLARYRRLLPVFLALLA